MKTFWTVGFCDHCHGAGYDICLKCEMPCEHDQLCPQCRGYEWYPAKVRDGIEYIVAKDAGWLYTSRRDAMSSIEYGSLA